MTDPAKPESAATINKMSLKEFWEKGFLQEANRTFFHPLGLALELSFDDSGEPTHISGVWDYRHEPEGIIFSEDTLSTEEALRKKENVVEERGKHLQARLQLMGAQIQPVGPKPV